MNITYPEEAYTQSWDGINYNFHQGSSRGTITFDLSQEILVGAIREEQSSRINWYPKYRASSLFDNAPKGAQLLAEQETLHYLLDEIDGITAPVATTAFWNNGNQIILYDTFNDFIVNGGGFISDINIPLDRVCEYWNKYYEITIDEFKVINQLYNLKKSGNMRINRSDLNVKNDNPQGYEEFITSLAELGFVVC
jgi:hypothetical protein